MRNAHAHAQGVKLKGKGDQRNLLVLVNSSVVGLWILLLLLLLDDSCSLFSSVLHSYGAPCALADETWGFFFHYQQICSAVKLDLWFHGRHVASLMMLTCTSLPPLRMHSRAHASDLWPAEAVGLSIAGQSAHTDTCAPTLWHYSLICTAHTPLVTRLVMLSHPPYSPTATACKTSVCRSRFARKHRHLYCCSSAAASIGVWPRALASCVNNGDVPTSPSAVPRAAPTLPL